MRLTSFLMMLCLALSLHSGLSAMEMIPVEAHNGRTLFFKDLPPGSHFTTNAPDLFVVAQAYDPLARHHLVHIVNHELGRATLLVDRGLGHGPEDFATLQAFEVQVPVMIVNARTRSGNRGFSFVPHIPGIEVLFEARSPGLTLGPNREPSLLVPELPEDFTLPLHQSDDNGGYGFYYSASHKGQSLRMYPKGHEGISQMIQQNQQVLIQGPDGLSWTLVPGERSDRAWLRQGTDLIPLRIAYMGDRTIFAITLSDEETITERGLPGALVIDFRDHIAFAAINTGSLIKVQATLEPIQPIAALTPMPEKPAGTNQHADLERLTTGSGLLMSVNQYRWYAIPLASGLPGLRVVAFTAENPNNNIHFDAIGITLPGGALVVDASAAAAVTDLEKSSWLPDSFLISADGLQSITFDQKGEIMECEFNVPDNPLEGIPSAISKLLTD